MIWGLILYPEGKIIHKFLWTIVFCGLGMGAVAGSAIVFMVCGRQNGYPAVISCVWISLVLLGLFCNTLCFHLDMNFNFFGGADTPQLFIWNGVLMSVIGGGLTGFLSFTSKGKRFSKKKWNMIIRVTYLFSKQDM